MHDSRFTCVFGISGVGKTTMINAFLATHADWRGLVAGELLSEVLAVDGERLRTSARDVIEANQNLLAERVRSIRSQNPVQQWVLDAHAVITNDVQRVVVSVEIVRRINPTALVFIHDEAAAILHRRRQDAARPRPLPSLSEITADQELAIATCLGYSAALAVPLRRVVAGDQAAFVQALCAE